MIIGYARVSTLEQNPELQEHALRQAGAIRIFTDYESGSKTQRPQLTECLNYLRDHDGDVLVVWKLDRLGRSVRHVIDTVHNLGERGIAFRSLTEGFDILNSKPFVILGVLVLHQLTQIAIRTQRLEH